MKPCTRSATSSLEARAGEVVGLVGRSGSGKTTLLNVAAGWEVPDAGTVDAPGDGEPDWSDIAVMPQRLGLMEELSAQENVEYPARMAGVLDERRALIDDLIEALGLTALRARYPKETSLGEQQRIALARALVLRPRCSSPTSRPDIRTLVGLRGSCGSCARPPDAGCCCVIATHDHELIDQLDRGFSMADGRLTD